MRVYKYMHIHDIYNIIHELSHDDYIHFEPTKELSQLVYNYLLNKHDNLIDEKAYILEENEVIDFIKDELCVFNQEQVFNHFYDELIEKTYNITPNDYIGSMFHTMIVHMLKRETDYIGSYIDTHSVVFYVFKVEK